jgi:putative heme-binding domain-containing protein
MNLPHFLSRIVAAAALAISHAAAQDPNDPETERASFKVPEGFEVNLFASEKDGIVKPIQCRWDGRGRLWVIGSSTYPQLKPGEEPNDKCWIVEDSNRDGKADKFTVFADGLMIPTGIEIAPVSDASHSAVYLGEGTKLWLMTDTDGDGKTDKREIVLRGFGTGDNHQNINSFRWSPGGELMFCQGLHAFSRVETANGIVSLEEAGFFRYRPREGRLDAFYGGKGDPQNPWGWVWTRWGQPLLVAGNNGTMFYPLPEMIRGVQGGRRDTIWVNGKSRKTSGPEILESPDFPTEWQGAMIAAGYINRTVWTLKIEDDGAGFRIVDHPTLPPLMTSTHEAFRPIDAKLGPDGALYVADWYNPIIGHYQASFRHPDRDKGHGRIWRVTARKTEPKPAPANLIDAFFSSNRFARDQARRTLSSDPSALATLRERITSLDPDDAGTDFAVVQALGVFEAQEAIEPTILRRALDARTPDARAYAAGTLARWADRLPADFDIRPALEKLAGDEHPRVRLAAIVATANIVATWKADVFKIASTQPRDKFIDLALRSSAADKASPPAGVAKMPQPAQAPAKPSVASPIPATGLLRATPDFVAALVKEVRAKGDPRKGGEVFRRAELACTTCHKIGDAGGTIGPALDSIGSAQPLDFIIGTVLEPQREVKEGYETYTFTLKDGRVVVGSIVAGTTERFTVRDASGAEAALTATEVAEKKILGSLMPAGLVDRLSREDLRDLFAYLAGLGRPQ